MLKGGNNAGGWKKSLRMELVLENGNIMEDGNFVNGWK